MRYFATYFDSNYLIRVVPMLESLARNISEPYTVYALCLDADCSVNLERLQLREVVAVSLNTLEAGDEDLASVRASRSTTEYYFTCTPAFMRFLIKTYPFIDLLTYLDADLFFFSDVSSVYEEIGSASIAIIPHRFPIRAKEMEEKGKYNVGWISIRNDGNGAACLDWWHSKCIEWCYDRMEGDKYADQKYLDKWPHLFQQVRILKQLGVNAAPWNIEQYILRDLDRDVLLDNDILVFYHFQGYKQLSTRLYDTGLFFMGRKVSKDIVRRIHYPYLRAIRRAKGLLGKETIYKGTGNTRHHYNQALIETSFRYRIRCLMEGSAIGWFIGEPWYFDSRGLRLLCRLWDVARACVRQALLGLFYLLPPFILAISVKQFPVTGKYVPQGKQIILSQYLGLFRLYVDSKYTIERSLLCGGYELEVCNTLSQNIHPGDVCVDVGANMGSITFVMAANCGANGHIYSFEPGSLTYSRLANNLVLNPEWKDVITILQKGLGEKEHILYWQGDGHDGGNGGCLAEDGIWNSDGEEALITTLDRFAVEEQLKRLDFIKIDVEGMEIEVLQGGRETIRRFRPKILLETLKDFSEIRKRDLLNEITVYFEELDYILFRVGDNQRIKSVSDFGMNTLALPKERVCDISAPV